MDYSEEQGGSKQPGLPSAEACLDLLLEASSTLSGLLEWDEILPATLALSRRLIAADAVAVCRTEAGSTELRIAAADGLSPADLHACPDLTGDFAEIVSGPVTWNGESRAEFYFAEGTRSLLAVPLQVSGRLAGALLFGRQVCPYTEPETRLAAGLARLVSGAIGTAELTEERRLYRAAAEESRARAAWLAEASIIVNSSLDEHDTLAGMARLALAHTADWCAIDLIDGDGRMERRALVYADSARAAWAEEVSRFYPAKPDGPGLVAEVAGTGRSVLIPSLSPDIPNAAAHLKDSLSPLRDLGILSVLCVPLTVGSRRLGTISFLTAGSGRRLASEDLALVEDLARRVAMAVANARLFADAQRERAALKAAVEALRENEERLHMALVAGRMGIWEWNSRTDQLLISEELRAMCGFPPGVFAVPLRDVFRLVHAEDRAQIREIAAHALRERSRSEAEVRVVWPDGSVHWLLGAGQVVADAAGMPVRMLGVCREITERRHLEEKLRQSQKMESIALLAGGVAHDFNNLLTGIIGNASLVQDMLSWDSSARPLLEDVLAAGERAADLTRQLLAYSGKGHFVSARLDLSQLVRDISGLLRASVVKMIDVRLELAAGLPPIEADASQLQQVIMNLAVNGAEAIGEGPGVVTLCTSLEELRGTGSAGTLEELKPGRYVLLEVRDTGCGMGPDMLSRIFDPFFTTKFTGRGLGLAAVAGIVRRHHGAIRVHSSPGCGSSFRAWFPAVATGVRADSEPSGGARSSAGTVLIVDDEELVRRVARTSLEGFGYSVLVAADGVDAVEVLKCHASQVSLVLLDMTMPRMSGEETLRRLREIRPDVPVVISSGYSEMEASRRFQLGTLAGFIQKPYTAAALAERIRTVLGQAGTRRSSAASSIRGGAV